MDTETRSWARRKWTDFEGFVEGVIYDRDLSVSARLFGLFLRPFSYLFSAIVRLRLFLYSHRLLFKDRPLDCLVLVVGNLTVGGTGKTPVVELTKELMAKGKKVAILAAVTRARRSPAHPSGEGSLGVGTKPRPRSSAMERRCCSTPRRRATSPICWR